ncbi:oxidoreductase [Rhodococcus sp. D2-41]|uniref:PDR/VanB family oxidoreductase n=1 Tax=Speluncibacter jeojiensis TaxID=2710754 RepID=UPI002410A515|nr:PDR/VanB family oxidoreductase [Rhodococcus sp. D2-41]MDG3011579.1 oxidoreductase [Rhodococcus sp. D2-41]
MSTALDTGFDLALATYRSYLRVFTQSPAAELLSRPKPVRLAGFEQDLTVANVEHVADGVLALTLAADDGADLPHWTPGAHLDVILPSGRMRQYSLCGDIRDRKHYRIAVRRIEDGGGGSREIHETVRVGSTLRIRGPRNAFHMVQESSYLFVAAGIGITPMLSMIEQARRSGAHWRLVYLGRSRESLPFLDTLARYGDHVAVRTDDEHGLPDIAAVLGEAETGAAVYLCGPPALMDDAKSLLSEPNPTARLYSERFSPPPVRGGAEFDITLARTGTTVTVGANESALSAIRRVEPSVTYSCQQGFCGTCRAKVLCGEIDHRDTLLLDSERDDTMLPCVSRGEGTVVLDL